ncbi:MAG TPA: ChbG/HpnK family deacetylase [Gemmatimonadaceae bacterium]|nr:ChbG/HpnK family deacetylase [Gemmatimonadaceae bacterium]
MAYTHDDRRLIVNADDFGLSRAVTTGILEAAEAGAVTSASMIANLDDFEETCARARNFGRLPLGLHLNFTLGRPLTAARSLTSKEGDFYGLTTLIKRASLGMVDSADVTRECAAQLDRIGSAGIAVTHMDSHRHIHVHPALSGPVRQTATTRGVHAIRAPLEPITTNIGDWRATTKKLALSLTSRLGAAIPPVRGPDHFYGISLQGGKSFASRLFRLIPRLPSGTSEIMTHPGRNDSSLLALDPYSWQREAELVVLLSQQFRDVLDRQRITLTNFANLGLSTVG